LLTISISLDDCACRLSLSSSDFTVTLHPHPSPFTLTLTLHPSPSPYHHSPPQVADVPTATQTNSAFFSPGCTTHCATISNAFWNLKIGAP
jgi:hypothetical protein